jgi:histidinol dehydrogenase
VRVERVALGPELAGRLRAATAVAPAVRDAVAEIVARVREEGEAAVLDLTSRFDLGGARPRPLRVESMELRAALDAAPGPLREALKLAAANVRAVALAGVGSDREVDLPQGQRVVLRELPVRRAAIYVPGGRAPYPSTALMGAVAARAAGVEEVVVCSPPGEGGDVDPTTLAACALAGVDEVLRMGGAQAVAALALGTPEGLRPVDVIAGPGNVYVQEAKRQLSGVVGIDSFAGPSELLVVCDTGADFELVALDLLAQAEHGPASLVAAASRDGALLDAVGERLGAASAPPGGEADPGPTCWLVESTTLDAALAFAEELAPEHLQLMGPEAEALAPAVRSAGCLFVGAASGTAFGDYVAGSNHVLPTGGAARFASALGPRTFRRTMAEVRIGGAAPGLAPAGAAIARAEGFAAHAESMEARIRENGADG